MAYRVPVPRGTRILAEDGLRQGSEDVRATQTFRWPTSDGTMPPMPILGSGPSAPSVPLSAASAPFARMVWPPWTQKLGPVSRDLNVQDFSLVIGAAVGATIVTPSFVLQDGSVGWLQQMQLYILAPTATASFQYTLRFNQAPVQGFANKRSPPGVANLVLVEINDLQVRIPAGASIDVLITNLGGGVFTVGAGFAGWFHSLQAELDRWGPV